jgi:predicted metalloprotease with PDZ domain
MSEHIARLIFAHEFFHLWNGKSFTPSGEDSEWFKEGFSNYYTLKALHRIGYLTDESYLELLAGFFYQRYESDSAVGQQPLTRGDLKHEHWGLIYSGGMFVAIAQDLQIRSADFFARYVYGTERLPVAQFLALAGIETAEEDGRTIFTVRGDSDPDVNQVRRGFFGD